MQLHVTLLRQRNIGWDKMWSIIFHVPVSLDVNTSELCHTETSFKNESISEALTFKFISWNMAKNPLDEIRLSSLVCLEDLA